MFHLLTTLRIRISFLQAFHQFVYPNFQDVRSLTRHFEQCNHLTAFLCFLMIHLMYFHIPKYALKASELVFVFLPNHHNNSVSLLYNLYHQGISENVYFSFFTSFFNSSRTIFLTSDCLTNDSTFPL